MNILDRFAQLNNGAEEKSVMDSIDRPIRKLVLHMNRIGLRTKFSCCGFEYPDEEEPKSHADKPFIQFYRPNSEYAITLLNFIDASISQGWTLRKIVPEIYIIQYDINDEMRNQWRKVSPGNIALHDYEYATLAIHRLEKTIEIWDGIDEFTIEDGNTIYHQMGIEWLVKPKQSALFQFQKTEIDNAVTV